MSKENDLAVNCMGQQLKVLLLSFVEHICTREIPKLF